VWITEMILEASVDIIQAPLDPIQRFNDLADGDLRCSYLLFRPSGPFQQTSDTRIDPAKHPQQNAFWFVTHPSTLCPDRGVAARPQWRFSRPYENHPARPENQQAKAAVP
jgi:hypothetical protein